MGYGESWMKHVMDLDIDAHVLNIVSYETGLSTINFNRHTNTPHSFQFLWTHQSNIDVINILWNFQTNTFMVGKS